MRAVPGEAPGEAREGARARGAGERLRWDAAGRGAGARFGARRGHPPLKIRPGGIEPGTFYLRPRNSPMSTLSQNGYGQLQWYICTLIAQTKPTKQLHSIAGKVLSKR